MAPEHRQRDDSPNLTFTHVINTSNHRSHVHLSSTATN